MTLVLTCRTATPLAYFLHSAGPAAAPVMLLGWSLAALCVCVAILVLLTLARHRRRHPAPVAPIPAEGSVGPHDSAEPETTANRIVIAGTVISAVLLFGALIAMLRVLGAVANPPVSPSLAISVTAHDW